LTTWRGWSNSLSSGNSYPSDWASTGRTCSWRNYGHLHSVIVVCGLRSR
jgi:hypothetical protein